MVKDEFSLKVNKSLTMEKKRERLCKFLEDENYMEALFFRNTGGSHILEYMQKEAIEE